MPHPLSLIPNPLRFITYVLSLIPYPYLLLILLYSCSENKESPLLTFSCDENNDIYQAACTTYGDLPRYDTYEEALLFAPENAGVLLLAHQYPETIEIDPSILEIAKEKNLRLYIEYPASLPGMSFQEPLTIKMERAVVTSNFFGESLDVMDIMYLHDAKFLPVQHNHPAMVIARVAGFDKAVYGLDSTKTYPLLFEYDKEKILVSTTKLSQCVTSRFGPDNDLKSVWNRIFTFLAPEKDFQSLNWVPSVAPTYLRSDKLPENVESVALTKGIDWYYNSCMLLDSSWEDYYYSHGTQSTGPLAFDSLKPGDGSYGILEGYASTIKADGTQEARWWRRADCTAESAAAMALAGEAQGNNEYKKTAANLCDWFCFKSMMTQGERADKNHPAYGLSGWHDMPKYWGELDGYGVYYNDDQPRVAMTIAITAAMLKTDRWNEFVLKNCLANLRITGPQGFRERRLDEKPLEKNGWKYYYERDYIHLSPHFQSKLWAVFLWMYKATGYDLFLERARSGIKMTMEAYPDKWKWTNGIQQERAKMLLPLAWLIRVDDQPKHREWLRFMTEEILKSQDSCGAVMEELGENKGKYGPPKSNKEYGTTEAPLIHKNGDELADMLYTSNYLFLSLHEAYAATANAYYKEAEDKLADFMCRIQINSKSHPELDGGWYRAFDYNRWDYVGSNSDWDWGVWMIETGWTQSWITSVLALREMDTSVWDVINSVEFSPEKFNIYKNEMMPDVDN